MKNTLQKESIMVRRNSLKAIITIMATAIFLSAGVGVFAQAKKPVFPRMPIVNSPEVLPNRSIVFRILMRGGFIKSMEEFSKDFVNDIMPYVETHYRVLTDRGDRAIAGLSMGGMQTLNIAMSHLGKFSYIGVFSSGVFGMSPGSPFHSYSSRWVQQRLSTLDNRDLKKGLKLLWFESGNEDPLLQTTKATMEMLKKHGFSLVFKETGGGHTWANWREYLNEFAPQLFR